MDWKKQVFLQKNLWAVFRERRAFGRTRTNRLVFWSFALAFLSFFLFVVLTEEKYFSVNQLADMARDWADNGFVFALGILGFLIAGFSIFASVTKAELFIMLAKVAYKDSGLNQLQFLFFNFLNIFVVYIGLLSICLVVILGFSENGPLNILGGFLLARWPEIGVPFNALAIFVLGLWFVEAVLKLKSFIWNLYQAVLLVIVAEAEFFGDDKA